MLLPSWQPVRKYFFCFTTIVQFWRCMHSQFHTQHTIDVRWQSFYKSAPPQRSNNGWHDVVIFKSCEVSFMALFDYCVTTYDPDFCPGFFPNKLPLKYYQLKQLSFCCFHNFTRESVKYEDGSCFVWIVSSITWLIMTTSAPQKWPILCRVGR